MDPTKFIPLFLEHAPGLLGWIVAAYLFYSNAQRDKENSKVTDKVLNVVTANTEAMASFRTLLEERVPRGGS